MSATVLQTIPTAVIANSTTALSPKVKSLFEFLKVNDDGTENSKLLLGVTNALLKEAKNFCPNLRAYIWDIKKNSKGYELIDEYIRNTSDHGYKIEIRDIYQVNRREEKRRYYPHKQGGNRMLLWHGSESINIESIILNGLQVATAKQGCMFGRGLYFSDVASKAANYSLGNFGNSGVLVLAEIALGNCHKLTRADHSLTAPPGFQSVQGIGKKQPDPASTYVRKDTVQIPLGKLIPTTGVTGKLRYNEYAVYDDAKVNIQYLVLFDKK